MSNWLIGCVSRCNGLFATNKQGALGALNRQTEKDRERRRSHSDIGITRLRPSSLAL